MLSLIRAFIWDGILIKLMHPNENFGAKMCVCDHVWVSILVFILNQILFAREDSSSNPYINVI